MPSRRRVLTSLGASGLAFVAGCATGTRRPGTPRGSTPTKVTYLTGYQNTPREQHVRVAAAKGYFKDVGLDVTVQPGQPAEFNFQQLAAGHAQFASVDFVSAVRGAGTYPFQAIAAIQQSTLLGFVFLASKHYSVPGDVTGKTIGTAAGGATSMLFPVYAKLARINPSVTWENATPDQLPVLLGAGKIDLMATYVSDMATIAAATKQAVGSLPYERYLGDLYGSVAIASTQTIQKQPEVVRRFAQAIVRGIVYTVNHPDEAAQIVKRDLPTTNTAAAADVFRAMKQYVTGSGKAGQLEQARVMRGIALLVGGGIIPPGQVTPEQLVAFNLVPKAA